MLAGVTEAARLFIESSTPRASLALLRGSEWVFEESFIGDRSHNALLFAPLERALACLEPGERLSAVVVGTGPGSYSGTRVGIAAGQGVALVHGCPAVGLSSLLAVPSARGGRALALGDARRGSGWRAGIDAGRLEGGPELCGVAELVEEVRRARAEGRPVFSLEPVGQLGLEVAVEQPDAQRLAAAWLALDEAERQALAAIPPQPAYLRPPHVTAAKGGHPLLRKPAGPGR
jgi:tRNA threonylcarbamoyl adenosine modification protein YeaZ